MFQYDLETKCQSAECRTKLSLSFTCKSPPRVKIMLIILFDKQNLIHKESELEGKTTDSEFHVQVLEWLMEQISIVRL